MTMFVKIIQQPSTFLILHTSWLTIATEFGAISPGKIIDFFSLHTSLPPSLFCLLPPPLVILPLCSLHCLRQILHRLLSWTRYTSSFGSLFSLYIPPPFPVACVKGFRLMFTLVILLKTFRNSGILMKRLSKRLSSWSLFRVTMVGGRLSSWFIPRLRLCRLVRKPTVDGKPAEVKQLLERLRCVSPTSLPIVSGTDSSLLLCRSSHLSDSKFPMLVGSFCNWLRLRSNSSTLLNFKIHLGKMVKPMLLSVSLRRPSGVSRIAFLAVLRVSFVPLAAFPLGMVLQHTNIYWTVLFKFSAQPLLWHLPPSGWFTINYLIYTTAQYHSKCVYVYVWVCVCKADVIYSDTRAYVWPGGVRESMLSQEWEPEQCVCVCLCHSVMSALARAHSVLPMGGI